MENVPPSELIDFTPPEAVGPATFAPEDVPVTPDGAAGGGQVGGIDILVSMASKGEIDPKNIDILDVTDRFLRAIAAAPKDNLRQSGKILFHASVLLRMKAEAMLNFSLDDGDDFVDYDEDGSPIIYDSRNEPIARQITLQDLERAIVRRSNNRQLRQRRVTLDQLIEALREAERVDGVQSRRVKQPRIDLEGQPVVNDVEDILDLAHEEDIDLVIQRVEEVIANVVSSGNMMSLIELIKVLGGRGDWVDAFLAVLFLSNAGKITLEQEEFYGPLLLSRPEVVTPQAESTRGS
jgi:segregation and condensation protein A